MSDREKPSRNQAESSSDESARGIAKYEKDNATRKGDPSLIEGKEVVEFRTAEQYLGVTERQRQNLIRRKILATVGEGQNRQVTTVSLKLYLPPRKPEIPQG